MKQFSELGIEKDNDKYVGPKIGVDDILNTKIIVHKAKTEPSKLPKSKPGDLCLYLQIEVNGEKRVVFTGSKSLLDLISKTNKDKDFPFETTIRKVDRSLDFT